jgi:citrate lyase subunit beta/citryl-CoA lyase
MLPKVESASSIAMVSARLGTVIPIIALIETAKGLAHLSEIADMAGVAILAFGSVDFSLDIGCHHEQQPLLAARSEIVWRSRAADLAAPLDGVTAMLDDAEMLDADARHAVALGFGGKLAIHPKQIAPIRNAFAPSEQAILWARAVLAAASSGNAVRVEGEMVDRPVIERARRILSMVERSCTQDIVG